MGVQADVTGGKRRERRGRGGQKCLQGLLVKVSVLLGHF